MIAKASAIQHGQAMTNYATKNNRADIVKTNHLSEGLPPMGMWDEMVLHQSMFKQRYAKKPIELTSIRFEIAIHVDAVHHQMQVGNATLGVTVKGGKIL